MWKAFEDKFEGLIIFL